MANKIQTIISALLVLLLLTNIASALTIKSVNAETLSPGKEGLISIEVENNLDDIVEDVTASIDLKGLSFITIGSSEDSINEIDEDDKETFNFRIKAANTIKPGDYQIPFAISYRIGDVQKSNQGSVGVTVRANADITYSISTTTPVINQQGKISFQIVNKGFDDARFVSLRAIPEGFTLLSDSEVYIGTVSSDDFQSTSFDVIFKEANPIFTAIVEYKDFDNKKIISTVNLPITVYTQEQALKLGIIKKNNTPLYLGIIVGLIIIYLIYRSIRRRIRRARSKKGG